jgi:hypothetical protein
VTSLRDFIAANLDKDEAVAREAISFREAYDPPAEEPNYEAMGSLDPMMIAVLVSPDRVLREVAAKRELLDRYASAERSSAGTLSNDSDLYYAEALEEAARILAAVYSDHPDFDPNWSTT